MIFICLVNKIFYSKLYPVLSLQRQSCTHNIRTRKDLRWSFHLLVTSQQDVNSGNLQCLNQYLFVQHTAQSIQVKWKRKFENFNQADWPNCFKKTEYRFIKIFNIKLIQLSRFKFQIVSKSSIKRKVSVEVRIYQKRGLRKYAVNPWQPKGNQIQIQIQKNVQKTR